MVRSVTIQSYKTFVLRAALAVALTLSLDARPAGAQNYTYPLSYSGRLTLPGGEPMQGPVDIELRFWDAATDGNALSRPFKTGGVTLNQGVFQLRIQVTDAEVEEVFGDGTKTVYVEITAKDIKYPRQEFTYVPLAFRALRIPIDNKTLKFTSEGKLKVEVPTRPSSNSVLVVDGQGKFNWEPFTVTQTGSGTTTVAITAGTGLNGGTITSTGTISLAPTGVTAGTYAKAQLVIDSTGRVTGATSGAPVDLATEVAGTLPVSRGGTGATSLAANSVLVGNGTNALQAVAPGAGGNILTSNGTAWISDAPPTANGTTTGYLTSSDWSAFSLKQSAGNYLTSLTGDLTTSGYSSGSATATLATVAIPGTSTKVTYDVKGRVTQGTSLAASDIPPLSAAKITSGTLPVALGGTGADLSTTGGGGQYLKQPTNGGAITVGAIPASDITQSLGYPPLNKAGDTMSGALNAGAFDIKNAGNIEMAPSKTLSLGTYVTDPTGLGVGDVGKTWFNSTGNQIKYWNGSSAVALGVAGSGLSSLNGQTGNTQTFPTPGTGGNAPSWTSSGDAHRLNIPLASAANVTAGLISSTEFAAFSSKVSNVAEGTGISISSASGTATVGLATIGTVGSYSKVVTDAYGRVASGTTLTQSDLPPHSAGLINSGTLSVANGGTGATSLPTNNVILGNGTSTVQVVAPGTNGNVLTSNGTTWQSTALPPSVTSVSATAPIEVSGATTPVVSITQAGASANGYLSSADWNTFNTKQSPGNYIAQLAGDVTLSGYASGTATTSLANISLAGTSTKVTYDVKGRVTSGTSLTASDLPPLSAALITAGTLQVGNGGTGLSAAPTNGQIPIGNGTGYTLANLTGGTGITVTNAAGGITIASTVDTATKISKTGDTMTGVLNLPANGLVAGTSQLVLANGNVGIGTTAPAAALDVNGSIKISGGTPGAGKVLTSDATGLASWTTPPAGTVTSVGITAPASGITVASGSPVTGSGSITLALANDLNALESLATTGLAKRTGTDTWTTVTDNSANWDTAYTDRLKWDGSATGLVAATGRTSLGLGSLATLSTVGSTEITDSSIADADISASAAIADTKLATISTAGKVSGSAITSGSIGGTTAISTSGIITTSGNVGIGTTSPAGKLDVAGSICLNGANCITSWPSGSGNWATSGSDSYLSSGKLGLGTSSPAADLSFGGTLARTIQVDRNTGAGTAGGGLTVQAGGAISGGSNYNGGTLTLASGVATGTGSSAIEFKTTSSGSSGATDSSPTTKMTILGSGNVGIGTTAPVSALQIVTGGSTVSLNSDTAAFQISGGGESQQLAFGIDNASPWGVWIQGKRKSNDGTAWPLKLQPAGGNVGIGTTSPVAPLHVSSSNVTANSWDRGIANFYFPGNGPQGGGLGSYKARGTAVSPSSVADGDYMGALILGGYDGSSFLTTAGILSRVSGTVATGSIPTDIIFTSGSSTNNWTERMRITSAGNVGIGTTAPGAKLAIGGTAGTDGIMFPDGSTQTTAVSAGITSCPTGFTLVGSSGKRGTYCIETNSRSAQPWFAAKDTCRGLNLATGMAFLCNHDEWYNACASSAVTGMTGHWEWINQVFTYAATVNSIAAGGTNCTSVGNDAPTSSYVFRCCIH